MTFTPPAYESWVSYRDRFKENNYEINTIEKTWENFKTESVKHQHKTAKIQSISIRAGTNTPSDEYDSYREYRVANTNMYSRIHFFSEAKLGNGLSVIVYKRG